MSGPAAAPAAPYGRIREIPEAVEANVACTGNTTQVVANWLISREIVEAVQRGCQQADYGPRLLATLSARLAESFGRRWSVDYLEAFRQVYRLCLGLTSGAASRKSVAPLISKTASQGRT